MLGELTGRLWFRAAMIYLALRLVSAVLLALAGREQVWNPLVTGPAPDDIDLRVSWDAKWYEQIATVGYPDDLPLDGDGRVQQNPWAFYPLFPYAVRAVMTLTRLDFVSVAPVLALLAGLGAAVVMARLLQDTLPSARAGSQAGALAAVAVWAALPAAPVLQMAYTESFSMLLLLTYLLLLVRRRWWGAALTALVLGLTRPIALPLSVVVLVAAWLRWRRRDVEPLSRREGAGLAAAVVATGLSGVLWTAVAWWGTGRRDAYPATMAAWRGDDRLAFLEPWTRTISWAWHYHQPQFVVPALTIVLALAVALAACVPRVAPGLDVRLKVWMAAYAVYLLAVVDGTTSIVRYLVPLFPLAVVLAGAHRERLSPWWRVRTAFFVVLGIVGQVAWIWWLVVFVPPSDFPP